MTAIDPRDEQPHAGLVDEWVFTAWTADASLGIVSGHRLFERHSWYWCALVEADRPLLHLTEWEIPRRRDPFVLKAPEMWAEHQCDAALDQWSIGNEAYFVAMDDSDEALRRCYGNPMPVAMDLEWYAAGEPETVRDGFRQVGVVHGEIELMHRPNIEMAEIPALRWRRWGGALDALEPAATGGTAWLRAPFVFPDGAVSDWVLSPEGWRVR